MSGRPHGASRTRSRHAGAEQSRAMRLHTLAHVLATWQVQVLVEGQPLVAATPGGAAVWRDTSALLDEREAPPEWIDDNRMTLEYAIGCQLVVQHPTLPHLVRPTWPEAPHGHG